MREKLQSLPMTELREIAKANGIKSVTTMRKESLIDKILECQKKDESKVVESKPEVGEARAEAARTESRYEARAESRTESRYEAKPESRSESRYESKPEARTDSRPESRFEQRTENRGNKLFIPPVCPPVNLDGSLSPEEEAKQLQADYYDPALDSGERSYGILEIMSEGFGFIRCEN